MNGPRYITEFQYLGPLRSTRAEDPAAVTRHLLYAENPIGPLVEWWRHRPSNTVFLAERHTGTDRIIRTWLADGSETQNV
ncbi:MAG: sarcosine oxidase subunit delta [Alphaproteobacteria bacterium]